VGLSGLYVGLSGLYVGLSQVKFFSLTASDPIQNTLGYNEHDGLQEVVDPSEGSILMVERKSYAKFENKFFTLSV
jgi:hypothetical protein